MNSPADRKRNSSDLGDPQTLKQYISMHQTIRNTAQIILLIIFCLFTEQFCLAGTGNQLSQGQDIYIPAYSHIYHGNKETPLLLSVTLSIRNIDLNNSITISRIDYHETDGPLVKQYISEPITLGPLGSERFVVPQKDNTGGSGANFIVTWKADTPTNPPIVESVMIGTQSQLGISFTSRGQALE